MGTLVTLAQAPDICIVTVDEASNDNMIGWDKTLFVADSYNVYKEDTPGSGTYSILNNVPFGSLSVYLDVTSDPDVINASYKITTLIGGNESAQSAPHATMILGSLIGPGGEVSMTWTPYAGFAPATYNIWRGATSSTMVQIDNIPATVTAYADINPLLGTSCYRIQAVNPAGCVPTAPSTPLTSFSNTSCQTILSISNNPVNVITVSVAPNPFSNFAVLTIEGAVEEMEFELFNMIGKRVRALQKFSGSTLEVTRAGLPDGIYLYRLSNQEGLLSTGKLIIN